MIPRLRAGRSGALVGSLVGNDGGGIQSITSGLDDNGGVGGGGGGVPAQAMFWTGTDEVFWTGSDNVLWE